MGDALGKNYQWNVKPNSWAVVTGATDGIGLEYARAFAEKGFNLLLIGRNEAKLSDVKASIKTRYSKCKEIKVLVIDFSKPDGIYNTIQKEVDSLPDVHVLVNCVGISYCTPEYYSQLEVTNSPTFVDDIINVNLVSAAKMVKIVLPKMEKQGRGVIINVSSIAAAYPSPLLSLYAATKIFVDLFSRSVHAEYKEKGIIIQSVLPHLVATKLSKIKKPSLFIPTPANFVKGAMKTIGLENRTYGYWSHKLQGFGLDQILYNIFGEGSIVKIMEMEALPKHKAYYRKYVNVKKE